MTLDAMHWVWNHSQSTGNPRIALLAVADQVRTSACEVRFSYSDFMRALNVNNRTVVRDAIKSAVKSGELEIAEPGRGTRPALYRLPKAVGYSRSGTDSVLVSGTESAPQGQDLDRPSGTESVPQQYESRTASGTDSAPHSPTQPPKREGAIDADDFPAFARPLSDQLGLADIHVRWPFNATEWFKLDAAIKKSGIPALVDYARRSYSRQNGNVDSARYFLRGWCELPPMPSADAERPPLRAVSGGTGWKPYTNPTDHSVYQKGWTR